MWWERRSGVGLFVANGQKERFIDWASSSKITGNMQAVEVKPEEVDRKNNSPASRGNTEPEKAKMNPGKTTRILVGGPSFT